MIDRNIEETAHPRPGGRGRRAVDGLVIDDRYVWLVLGDDEVDTVRLLLGSVAHAAECLPFDSGTRICRRVEGDSVVIGPPDPEHDRLISELLEEGY